MTRGDEERRLRRARLAARAEAQREELSRLVGALELPLRAADAGIAIARTLRRHRQAFASADGRGGGKVRRLLLAAQRLFTGWSIVQIVRTQIRAAADRRRDRAPRLECRPARRALHRTRDLHGHGHGAGSSRRSRR